mmetsp:Transcript_31740/g.71174  ORF Transcript_31740/g.71174 Transcript_31740/m.71174 type:complete len:230 (-) Transcript_31740:1810-2499(-)
MASAIPGTREQLQSHSKALKSGRSSSSRKMVGAKKEVSIFHSCTGISAKRDWSHRGFATWSSSSSNGPGGGGCGFSGSSNPTPTVFTFAPSSARTIQGCRAEACHSGQTTCVASVTSSVRFQDTWTSSENRQSFCPRGTVRPQLQTCSQDQHRRGRSSKSSVLAGGASTSKTMSVAFTCWAVADAMKSWSTWKTKCNCPGGATIQHTSSPGVLLQGVNSTGHLYPSVDR